MMLSKPLTIVALSLSVSLAAQNTTDVRDKINDIKRSARYLSAEATDTLRANASKAAQIRLQEEVEAWIEERGGVTKPVGGLAPLCQELEMMRGRYYRVLAYIKKSDLTGEEEPEPEQANGTGATLNGGATQQQDGKPAAKPVKTTAQLLAEIRSATTYAQVQPLFQELKAEGRLTSSMIKSEADLKDGYVIVISPQYEVKAVLQHEGGSLKNLATGAVMKLAAYSGNQAVWFELK